MPAAKPPTQPRALGSLGIAASAALNVLLLVALLAQQQRDSARSVAAAPAAWCQPRPGPLARFGQPAAVATAVEVAAVSTPPPPPPSPAPIAATELLPSPALAPPPSGAAATTASFATDEKRLKQIWWHPPCGSNDPRALPCNSRSYKEVHDSRWAFLDDRLMARGLATVGDPLRMRCLGEKLMAGMATHLSVLGGSVSFGTTFTTSKSRALFHWKVFQYLNSSFPGARHEHFMGAVPASGPSYMEHCVAWHLPPVGADIILVEYAVNFDGQEDFASFERLIRRLLRLPNHPAIIIVNVAELVPPGGRLPWEPDDTTTYPSRRDLEFEYKSTGAEDAIHAIADYYAVPCVSLRGALFAALKSNSSRFPIKQIYHDRHHPSAWGHSLLAQMVVAQLDAAFTHVAAARGDGGAGGGLGASCVLARQEMGRIAPDGVPTAEHPGPALFAPLYSKGDQAPVGACYKDQELENRIHRAKGFAYTIEGVDMKMKPGIVGRRPGDWVQFCLDVERLEPGAPFVFILGHLISYEHMGAARIACLGDCACEAQDVDAHVEGGKFSVFKAKTFTAHRVRRPAVRGACGCKIEVTIRNQTGSGEYKFKVLSLMTASKEGSLRYGHQAGFNNRPTEARFQ